MTSPATPAVTCRGVSKRCPDGTFANQQIDLSVHFGEVVAVIGENGAGKTTLMKMIAGLEAPDAGEVLIRGERLSPATPAEAIARGVGMVHQHFMLVESCSVAEAVALGREPRRGLRMDTAKVAQDIVALGKRFGLSVDPAQTIASLSVGEKQRVEILKVLSRGAEIFIFDEPTAVLAPPEVAGFLDTIRTLKAERKAVLLISHKLDEVLAVADRITVLRAGRVVEELPAAGASPRDLARAMVGREVTLPGEVRATSSKAPGETLLAVEGIHARGARGEPALVDVSVSVRAGEIVGIAGIEGNGQRELGHVIAGLLPVTQGRIRLGADDITKVSPRERLRRGLAHIPEDRQGRGLVLDQSLAENLLLGREDEATGRFGVLDRAKMQAHARDRLEALDVRPRDPSALARGLSGGNQQKVVAARELARGFRVLLAAQPTRGVDVGAIELLHQQLRAVREQGRGVLLVSADLDEILALSDRVLVLFRGRVVGEASAQDASREQLGAWMAGLKTRAGAA